MDPLRSKSPMRGCQERAHRACREAPLSGPRLPKGALQESARRSCDRGATRARPPADLRLEALRVSPLEGVGQDERLGRR
jgi:hypothetical protein